MLLYVVLTAFLSGLMVGRTPEYLGRKLEAREVKWTMLACLTMPFGILIGAALSASLPTGLASVQDPGPHGLSEILSAYASSLGNNGSAFADCGADTGRQNTALGLLMVQGRHAIFLPMLAIAGGLAIKAKAPVTGGTFPTHGPLFVTLPVLTVQILGALTFIPVLALGPIAEQAAIGASINY